MSDKGAVNLLLWDRLYNEAELYKAAVRLYTKPLFSWRKALSTSTDERNLYDFARGGLKNIDILHRQLRAKSFRFRPGQARHFNFNGKEHTLYIYPWEERLVDLLLYRILTRRLETWFSPHSYAYREGHYGVDRCQRAVARALLPGTGPLYLVRRDIRDYFASIPHELLLEKMRKLVAEDDYLFELLLQRLRFEYEEEGVLRTAREGIPFGAAIACCFANVYLTGLDRGLGSVAGLRFFRYADDILVAARRRQDAVRAADILSLHFQRLGLASKPSHEQNLVFSQEPYSDVRFHWCDRIRHLGLLFRANGVTGLSRDKTRKIQNRFKYAFRRRAGRFRRISSVERRARLSLRARKQRLQNPREREGPPVDGCDGRQGHCLRQ